MDAAIKKLNSISRQLTGFEIFTHSPGDSTNQEIKKFGKDAFHFLQNWKPATRILVEFPCPGMAFFDSKQALETYRELSEIENPLEDVDASDFDNSREIREDLFWQDQLPLAYSENSQTFLMVDNNPGELGKSGQVITNIDAFEMNVMADSLTAFFELTVLALELDEISISLSSAGSLQLKLANGQSPSPHSFSDLLKRVVR